MTAGSEDTSDGHRCSCLSQITLILALTVLAFSTRILPISISPLPFNNDGISECRIASDIMNSGHLQYPASGFYVDTHSVITPAYNVLLAYVASTLGATPYEIAQVCIGVFSVITVVGGYYIALSIVKSLRGATVAALFLALFGTFVYLTGSTWKGSIGVALFVLLLLAYMNRTRREMMVLEIVLLTVLLITHHLVAFVAYLTIGYLTAWSIFYAVFHKSFRKRHVADLLVITVPSIGGLAYYSVSSLDRLNQIGTAMSLLQMGAAIAITCTVAILILGKKRHSKYTFAPVPATVVFIAFLWDYSNPFFPYIQGFSNYLPILAFGASLLIYCAWVGIEHVLEFVSRYRAVPISLLLPVSTLLIFIVVSGFTLQSHQILYRSFDYADIGLAIGVAACIRHLSSRPRIQRLTMVGVVLALLFTFPFGYATDSLIGVRHDTQEYEVDCIDWIHESAEYTYHIESDERLSYTSRAIYDYLKLPGLPYRLENQLDLPHNYLYMYLEEWTYDGVSDYPRGRVVVDSAYLHALTSNATVLYIGGPAVNNVVVFCDSRLSSS